ncbi:MAG TPA: HEAT repeat domain-containing protein [Vicinamibacterales bacterium]|nr:HEAT repeat domain-containing protein [Vicinamibacterales bacterium]
MATPAPAEHMSAQQSAALADFARTCKAAARSVSLYPATHPAIQGALGRVVNASRRLTADGDVTITVLPDALVIDGRTPSKPDAAIGEFAELLHERLVGELRIERDADATDWRTLLLLLSRTTEELMADGGISKAWAESGRAHFDIREIDYAEVLRERSGSEGAAWKSIIEFCLQGDTSAAIDERTLEAVIGALDNPERFNELLQAVQSAPAGAASMGARAAALLGLIQKAIERLQARGELDQSAVTQTIADSAARMTPDMMLSLIQQAREPTDTGEASLAATIISQIGEDTIASFVGNAVVAEHGASERLALAFEALVPEAERKERLLDVAKETAAQSPLGGEAGFENLWQNAAELLMSYSDKPFVSDEYGRELSSTRLQATEVERLTDDPEERLQAWRDSVSDEAIRVLDLALIQDLLRIEAEPDAWQAIAIVAADEVERRTLLGDVETAQALLDLLVAERGEQGRVALRPVAETIVSKLSSGQIVRHIVFHLRKVEDVEPLSRLAHTLGPSVVRPLAIALAAEENSRAIRHLRELLLGFGAAGRQSVEQLKNSANPAVRRMAIDLLRVFGGREALPELASMLDDADPQVQRESIRAIVQIGTDEAFAILEKALVGGAASRDTILQQLIGLREDKAIPLLCYVLNHTSPRGKLVSVHAQIIEALGTLPAHKDSTRTLRNILYRGEWWAPFRTAALRRAAAAALRHIGTPEAMTLLQEAATRGSRGVRAAAKKYAPAAAREVV